MQTRHATTAPTVVGYANNDAGKPAQQCLASSFKTIGLTFQDEQGVECEGVRLSDLKLVGYDVDEELKYGDIWTDNFVINMLDTDGSNLYKDGLMWTYHWVDNDSYSAGWYDENYDPIDGTSPLGDADEIYFAVGTGIQFTNGLEDDRIRLVCNGEVVEAAVDYRAWMPAQQCAANPFPRKLFLSEITVSGYDVDEEAGYGDIWTDNIVINMLDTDGSNLYKDGLMWTYHWVDNDTYAAGWYDENYDPIDGTSPLGDANELGFEMGEGIQITNGIEDDRIVFHFPSLWASKPVKE